MTHRSCSSLLFSSETLQEADPSRQVLLPRPHSIQRVLRHRLAVMYETAVLSIGHTRLATAMGAVAQRYAGCIRRRICTAAWFTNRRPRSHPSPRLQVRDYQTDARLQSSPPRASPPNTPSSPPERTSSGRKQWPRYSPARLRDTSRQSRLTSSSRSSFRRLITTPRCPERSLCGGTRLAPASSSALTHPPPPPPLR